ncbi:GNAT family N-acetyltransferase [Paenibacillus sp. LHD-117]|uniref:GNAT family N-acetyltransferase n=1 Tax=Paenibacillus sp. LHD-117 TaxID=3071412 RepID=UPI0027E12EB5|nr:GNAT family N-acetyltransferase [Paenibacillus sp. LHD-117]MDQ6421703.1 GNAT family N-acetyltransferase [Paenibacillus sp. LHD-117]
MLSNLLQLRLIDKLHDEVPYELLLLADPSREMIDDYIARGRCYVAYLHDDAIGQFVLIATHPKTYEIVNIAVHENHQGKGFGTKLVLAAIDEARNLGARTIEIGTGNSSLPQLALYQKCGFRIAGIDHDFFVRHYEEAIVENGIPCKDMIRLKLDL